MDNIKDLDSEHNSGSISPISVPKLTDTNMAHEGDDYLSTRNDEDLFGEPAEVGQITEQELPQPLGEKKANQAKIEVFPEDEHVSALPSVETPFQDENMNSAGNDYDANESNRQSRSESKVKEEDREGNVVNVCEDEKDGNEKEGNVNEKDGNEKEGNVNEKEGNVNEKEGNVNEKDGNEKEGNVNENGDMDVNNEGNNNNYVDDAINKHTNLDEGGGVAGEDNIDNENMEKSERKPSTCADREGESEGFRNFPQPPTLANTKVSKPVVSTSNPIITSANTSITATATDDDELAVPQSHEIVIPSYSKWFNLTKIHPIEKQSLPEFFTNRIPSKTPQVYVKCRNFMVNSYRLNPNEYFSVTTARRNVCGDAAAVFRIHRFLMKWGVINYQVDAQSLPKSIEPPFTGEYSTRHDAPRGLFPFESYKPSVQLPDMTKLKKMMDTDDPNSALHKYLKEERRNSESHVTDVSDIKRENNGQNTRDDKADDKGDDDEERMKNPRSVKRPKIVQASTERNDGWNKDGVEKLLKSIQTYGSDWYKTAKAVGDKTPEQCILKFIQMPIEDRFLHQGGENGFDLGPLKYAPHLPFSKTENPVLSTLAFLVGLVDPKVVQDMTDRALRKIEPKEADKGGSPSSSSLSPPTIKDASQLAISSLAVRSHVFANNEERQMTSIAHQMAEIQLQKVEIKLKLLNRIEKSLELEKKALQKQQEDILLQRISLSKHTKNISQKLRESLTCFDDKDKLTHYVDEIENLVLHPPKISIGSAFTDSQTGTDPGGSAIGSEENIKPVSIEAPQSYRYWSA